MDIAFHYFAVKTLAREAGFPEDEAQRIAEFSQYVDDYNWKLYLNCSNIPEYAKYDEYDLVISFLWDNFNPAQTGFFGWVDYVFLATERNQKFVVSPFHFVPRGQVADVEKQKHIRTVPATLNDGSILSNLLRRVIDTYKDERALGQDTRITLMYLGMLLHTFADTYAHQMFSGYNSWVNKVELINAIDNATGEDITEEIQAEIRELSRRAANNEDNSANVDLIPAIGHAQAGHAPDLTYIAFTMQYQSKKDSGFDSIYNRSNTTTFLDASRQIINCLRKCLNKGDISDADWALINTRLSSAFLFKPNPKEDLFKQLVSRWRGIFSGYVYSYNKETIEKRFLFAGAENANVEAPALNATAYTEEFYRYNCMADQVLIGFYGPHPRRGWFLAEDGSDIYERPSP